MLTEIFGFVKDIISPVTTMIDKLTTTQEEKLTLKAKLTEIENTLTMKVLEHEQNVINSQKEVIIAELNQGDLYTKRARPTIIYAGLAIVAANHILFPWIAFFFDYVIPAINLPSEFWLAWGGVTGVYAWGRTIEKKNHK